MPTVTRPARRKPAQGTAAPRGSLNRDSIEAAALALIEAHGLEGFSTRKLGQQLGCEAMSIYYHFPSKAHLLDALVDRLLNEVPLPTPENSPGQRIRHLAQAWRVMSRRYPRFYRAGRAWIPRLGLLLARCNPRGNQRLCARAIIADATARR
jgi:AcrR family transcriptional regulator